MNIDERLERLAERTDALAQSLELMASMQRASEERHEKLSDENARRFAQVTRNFEVVLDSIKSLENIAASHEHRLDNLEQQH